MLADTALILICLAITVPVGVLVAVFLRRGRRHVWERFHRTAGAMPWYFHVLAAALFVGMIAAAGRSPVFAAAFTAVAVLCFAVMFFAFRRQRFQFGLRSLFAVTLAVAVLCSASYYVPVASLAIGVSMLAVLALFLFQRGR
jgi:hypothetical protein